MIDHIGENAALYALGLLDDADASSLLAHAATCDPCSRLLAQAQDDVAAMAETEPQYEAPPELATRLARSVDKKLVIPSSISRRHWYAPALAFAAALALSTVPASYLINQNRAMTSSMVYADAVERMVSSPHRTVAFKGTNAMVMYGNDGSWYAVFAKGAKALNVVWKHDGQMTMLGTMVRHGDVALLYLPKSHRMDQLAIMSDGQVVSQANLAFGG
jgi:anti-sigma factor RsiW